jgi:polysaccharide chain length determinant protein (PEP-CTERM system associated)
MMRTHIHINVKKEKGNVFTVSFQGTDPRIVMRVTNALASKFIEENLRVREERASETTSYVQDELRMSKDSLDKKDTLMRDYKLKYYNEMPDQRESNMARLNALHEQFQANQTNIQTLEQTRLLVSEQLASHRSRMTNASSGDTGSTGGESNNLAAARRNLQALQARYTPDHPAVKRAESQVQQLEQEEASLPPARSSAKGRVATMNPATTGTGDFSIQLKEIELNLKNLREESEKILGQIKTYQAWIDATPVREAEWMALTRDYNELRKYYDSLLAQSLTAAAAENIEMRQKGSQFKVVDSAYLPEKPMQGNFLKIIMIAIAAGLAGGGGIAVAADIMDTSFKNVQELESYLHIPVTCALPLIVLESESLQTRKRNRRWYCLYAAWFLILIIAATVFWIRGMIII